MQNSFYHKQLIFCEKQSQSLSNALCFVGMGNHLNPLPGLQNPLTAPFKIPHHNLSLDTWHTEIQKSSPKSRTWHTGICKHILALGFLVGPSQCRHFPIWFACKHILALPAVHQLIIMHSLLNDAHTPPGVSRGWHAQPLPRLPWLLGSAVTGVRIVHIAPKTWHYWGWPRLA